MNVLIKIKEKLEEIEKNPNLFSNETIAAKYPSSEWNTLSWSYLLVKDLIFWNDYCSDYDRHHKSDPGILKRFLQKRSVFKERYSYHGDPSRKVYLYKLLCDHKKSNKVIIPEVGPCGFDVAACLMAGYQEVRVLDLNSSYLEVCREIWGNFITQSSVLDSKEIENIRDLAEYDLIIPDWWHGADLMNHPTFLNVNCITYAKKSAFSEHYKKIDALDFFNFFRKLNQLSV
jgi:hypothetical protein